MERYIQEFINKSSVLQLA